MTSTFSTDDCQNEYQHSADMSRSVPRHTAEDIGSPRTASGICREAARLVEGDRAVDYGDKVENHENIAVLWRAYLGNRQANCITKFDVAIMMILLKIARTELGLRSPDTFVDMAGYAAIAGEIHFKSNN